MMSVATEGVLSVWSFRAFDGGGGEDGDPQSAIRAESFLRGEVVGVGLADVYRQCACGGSGVDKRERALFHAAFDTMHRSRNAGGCFVMSPAVSVNIFGEFRQTVGAGFAFIDHRILKEWCCGGGLGEFGAE